VCGDVSTTCHINTSRSGLLLTTKMRRHLPFLFAFQHILLLHTTLFVLPSSSSPSLSLSSPSDEMQKFIDECYVMIETMESCAEGWVQFEQEIIDSIDSFSDRIVYTQSLIMEEAELILDMANRIVETEAIMIDLLESCNCSDTKDNATTIPSGTQQKAISSPSTNEQNSLVSSDFVAMKTPSVNTTEHCSAMDYAIEVMDACIKTFEVYNDDFLEVLSYMVSESITRECQLMLFAL
jgi:hypothetical protein